MKVDFSHVINDLAGEPIVMGEGEAKKPVTLGHLAMTGLLNEQPKEELSGEDKMKRFLLAKSIHEAKGPLDVKAEDIVILRKLIASTWNILAVGRAFEVLPE